MTMKTVLFFALLVVCLEAFAPLSSRSHRCSLSTLDSTTSNKPQGAKDQVSDVDERLAQSINKHLEDEDPKSTLTFCLPLEKICLNDLPKVGG